MRAVTIFEARNNVCIIPCRRRVIADRSPADGGHHHGGNQLPERANLMAMRADGTTAFYFIVSAGCTLLLSALCCLLQYLTDHH